MKSLIIITSVLLLSACSIFGDNGVETTPYTVITKNDALNIEVRQYEPMIFVSASMNTDGRNNAFRKLFKYITGENEGTTEIAMTAPVFMDDESANTVGAEIAMTAPVFMDNNQQDPMMSFVMPSNFTIENTPKPTDPSVVVSQISNYKAATIQFSGTMSDSNVEKYTQILETWMAENQLKASSAAITAGYNGPLTLPMFRRNEILIKID